MAIFNELSAILDVSKILSKMATVASIQDRDLQWKSNTTKFGSIFN